MIRFDFCTAKTVWVNLADGERWQKELQAKTLADFLDHEEQVFVLLDGGQAVGIADEEQALHNEVCKKCFVLGPSMFQQARDYFRERQQTGEDVYVLDETAHVAGSVRYQMNFLNSGWQAPLPYWEYDFEQGLVNEDLLDKADGYLFQSLEEYSYAIACYICKHHPDREVCFWDPYGYWQALSPLWQGLRVRFLRSWGELPDGKRRWMFVDSEMKGTAAWMPAFIHLSYSSLQVMYSMLWGTHPVHLGPLHPDKKIALIDVPRNYTAGLVDLSFNICSCATYMERKGYIPVIDLSTKDCCSFWELGINVWEELFYPWSDSGITVEEARQSSHVIRGVEELDWWSGTRSWNPYFDENNYYSVCANYNGDKLRLNDKTWRYVLAHAPEELLPRLEACAFEETDGRIGRKREGAWKKRILGVKLRGTDYNLGQPGGASLDTAVEWCRSLMMSGIYDGLYLATEDRTYFERFQQEFSEKIISIEQPRIAGTMNAAANLSQYGSKIDMVRLYLADLKCLSLCNDFVTNRGNSGASMLVQWWRWLETGFCKVLTDDDPAPSSARIARIFLRAEDGEQKFALDDLDAQHPFSVRAVEPEDGFGEEGILLKSKGHEGTAQMKVHWGGTKLRVLLGSASFAPAGRPIPQWVTYTSFRVNGRECLAQPVDAWNQQPSSFLLQAEYGELELEVQWKPYPYAPKELAELLRCKLPRGGTPKWQALPLPPMPEKHS